MRLLPKSWELSAVSPATQDQSLLLPCTPFSDVRTLKLRIQLPSPPLVMPRLKTRTKHKKRLLLLSTELLRNQKASCSDSLFLATPVLTVELRLTTCSV